MADKSPTFALWAQFFGDAVGQSRLVLLLFFVVLDNGNSEETQRRQLSGVAQHGARIWCGSQAGLLSKKKNPDPNPNPDPRSGRRGKKRGRHSNGVGRAKDGFEGLGFRDSC